MDHLYYTSHTKKTSGSKGTECSAINCTKYAKTNKEVAFYSFPKDKIRCAEWIRNIQRVDLLGKSAEQMKWRRVCSDHFATSQFRNPNDRKSGLLPNGKPWLIDCPNPPKSSHVRRKQPHDWGRSAAAEDHDSSSMNGKHSLSKEEQLLKAIAENSDVEDFLDSEDNEPAVDGNVPLYFGTMSVEHQPNDSEECSLDLPENDSDEDYRPLDEDTDSSNENEPQHPHVHKHGCKRQRVENDELDMDEPGHREPRAGPSSNGCGEHWKSTPFTPNVVHFQGEENVLKDERANWQPIDYVEQYIDSQLMKLLADCTNTMSIANNGKLLNTTVEEMYHFFGAAILMSCVHYPNTRMFWSNALQIPAISDRMSRDRFFKLRSNLKIVIDNDIPENKKKADKFWKVRPFMDHILRGCRLQAQPECVSIGEQMIPFTGACPFQQNVPLKPNPVGMKNFFLASPDGIVLDFEVYQGAKTLSSQVQDSEGLSLGALVIKRLCGTLHAGTKVYCDQFFTTIPAVDLMLKKQIYLTGTVMKNRVSKATEKLPSDKTLKRQGRGASATVTRADGKLCIVKWYDNKPVVMLSAIHAEQPKDTCQRWSKKDKKYVTVTCPSIVQEYNTNMGGVDLSDRMMSYYRMSVRTKKWTIRMLMHFTDLSLVNSWLLYRQDNQESGTPRKAIMKFLEFRTVVAQVFLNKNGNLHKDASVVDAEEENVHPPQPGKRTRVIPVPHVSVRTRSAVHLPEMAVLKNPMRCRAQGCSGKSRVRCMTCNVFLCLQSERNCFAAFHKATQQQSEEKTLDGHHVSSSSLEQQDQHVKDDQQKVRPLSRQTEAAVNDCRHDIIAKVFQPVSEHIDEYIKYGHSVCGKTCDKSSQQPQKPMSGCEMKTEHQKNENVVSYFCNHTQSSLTSPIKEEVGDSESRSYMKLSCFFCGSEFATAGSLTRHISGHTGATLLTCVICKTTFTSESELVSHACASESLLQNESQTEEWTSDIKRFSCSQCGDGFSKSEDLNFHLRFHMRGNLFSCSVCNTSCSDKDSLIQHMRIHTRQTQFTCHVCGKDFAWRRHLTKHMEVHKKRKKVFRCRPCGAEFCTYYLLSKHKVVHQSSEIPHSQNEENKEENEQMETAADGEHSRGPQTTNNLNTDPDIQQETSVETSVSFKMEEEEFWKETGGLESNLTSVSQNECCQCDSKTDMQSFTLEEDLSHHTTEVHKEVKQESPEPPQIKEEEEEAEITKIIFNPGSVKTEDEEKPHSLQLHHSQTEEKKDCLRASDEDAKTSAFSDHDTDDSDCWKPKRKLQSGSNSESDSGRNPSSCSDNKTAESVQPESEDSVDSDFWKDYKKPQSTLYSLRQEATEKGVKYVTDLKPYSCTQCSKVFRYSSYLKIHMKQHTERYFCSVCGHKSTSSSNLKVHMRTHTGEKPFSCSVCGKKYTNKASMQSHMSVHDAERKYTCDECKKSFAWFTELKYHQCVGESSQQQTYEEDSDINLKRHILYS